VAPLPDALPTNREPGGRGLQDAADAGALVVVEDGGRGHGVGEGVVDAVAEAVAADALELRHDGPRGIHTADAGAEDVAGGAGAAHRRARASRAPAGW